MCLTDLRALLQLDIHRRLLSDPIQTLRDWKARDLDNAMMGVVEAVMGVVARLDRVSRKLHRLHSAHTS